MRSGFGRWTRTSGTTYAMAIVAGTGLFGCNDRPCESEDPDAAVTVAGTYGYTGFSAGFMSGTITFEQDGNTVRVVETTYNGVPNREVVGAGELKGNRLDIQLTPSNGDMDYRADVTFIFSEDGESFCVEFSDTNGDAGDLGSFTGTRI